MSIRHLLFVFSVLGLGAMALAREPVATPPENGAARVGRHAGGRKDSRKPDVIDGAKVSTTRGALKRGIQSYVTKQRGGGILSSIGVRTVDVIKIGYDVPGFARRGERLWQVQIGDLDRGELRGIIWIHPETEKAHFVTGDWIRKKEK